MSNNINDKATVSLFVNGEQAEDAMERLRKKAADLDKQLQDAMDAGKKKDARKLRKEIESVQKELNRTESAAKGTGIVLNDLSNSSIHGLRNALKYLKNELKMTKPDTEAWRNYAEQIKRVQGRIDELNEVSQHGQSLRIGLWAHGQLSICLLNGVVPWWMPEGRQWTRSLRWTRRWRTCESLPE